MSFWVREIFGWVLVVFGLLVCLLCIWVLMTPAPYILQSGPLSLIGIFIFRGGIHLIKVATAARVAMHVARMEQAAANPPAAALAGARRF